MGENGWNRPGNGTNTVRSAYRIPAKGIAVALLLSTGVAAWWFFFQTSERRSDLDSEVRKPGLIAEATPAPAPKAKEPEPPKPIDPNARPTRSCEIVNGYVKLPSGRIHKISGVITNSIANRPKAKYEIFDRNCNNEIAGYLTLRPGDVIVGTPNYNGRFKKDFIESISEPIIITDDDTPEQAQLKRDVIEARLQLKDAMDRGEDIEQIMLDTRKELQSLMQAKMELKHLFYEERKKCETEEDVEVLLSACNKLLEERGVAPITYGPITKRNLLRSQRASE